VRSCHGAHSMQCSSTASDFSNILAPCGQICVTVDLFYGFSTILFPGRELAKFVVEDVSSPRGVTKQVSK